MKGNTSMSKPTYSNYFTVVIYPDEFKRFELLYELGALYRSPIHNAYKHFRNKEPPNALAVANNEWIPYGYKPKKAHQHILIKTPNTYTENTFLVKLLGVLKNDITGIAIHQGDCFVKKPQTLLRYFYHVDNPTKEHFNLETAFECVEPQFTKEVASAFEVEITHIITHHIYNGDFTSLNDIIFYNSNSLVFEEFLRRSHNLYYVMSVFKENRFVNKLVIEERKQDYVRD